MKTPGKGQHLSSGYVSAIVCVRTLWTGSHHHGHIWLRTAASQTKTEKLRKMLLGIVKFQSPRKKSCFAHKLMQNLFLSEKREFFTTSTWKLMGWRHEMALCCCLLLETIRGERIAISAACTSCGPSQTLICNCTEDCSVCVVNQKTIAELLWKR